VVDRRQSAGQLTLALTVKLVLGLVASVEAGALLELLRRRDAALGARRLALPARPGEPEPFEIPANALGEGFRRALHVGVVEAQPEVAAGLARKQPVEQRRPHVADVKAPRGAWRE